jgi:hypothetical protein
MNPALRHAHHILRKTLRQPQRNLEINSERPEIARVHPDQIATRVKRPLQLVAIVHFTQNIQPAFARRGR